MTTSDLPNQLGLVEAQLFASTELVVITAIDASDDVAEAIERLSQLGMSHAQAGLVLDMPLSTRTRVARNALFAEAQRLRDLL